ncbi:hypothetical protein K435DRAFT_783350 [Dendrothele bispora CBS 962.96]|uniref:Polysaccharide lyase 14 domain-containing protein n=1 Tax=Dendrothele bispora (strain CBS 962.96) TaxID=1314807 RepID=A0A4V4HD06_DENBC|nr:hypothetical protein K435DRAFT_783350 [Dendrothele bispora CBS 962.96]
MLFPVPDFSKSWTTCSDSSDALPLDDETLVVSTDKKDLPHNYAVFPKGSYIPSKDPPGGLSFYASGPEEVDLTTAKEATFRYSVFFPDDFEHVKGGKLPGLYGGDDAENSKSCSGGRRDTSCFSIRLMWREEGSGELYTYLPDVDANKKQCDVPPESHCNPTRKWTTVSQRVKLNDAEEANGEMELFVGGDSVIKVTGLEIRDSDKGRMRGIIMQTFFGGSTPDYASPKDQSIYFGDFSMAITEEL